jgi:hypothetical protein
VSFQDSLHPIWQLFFAELPVLVFIEGHQSLNKTFAVIFCIARAWFLSWPRRGCIRAGGSAPATPAFSTIAWGGQFVCT